MTCSLASDIVVLPFGDDEVHDHARDRGDEKRDGKSWVPSPAQNSATEGENPVCNGAGPIAPNIAGRY